MSKIIYLIDQPLDERNYDRFGIQTWIDRGWNLEVWDLTPLSYPRVWQNYFETGFKLKEFKGYFPIASKSELECSYTRGEKIGYFIDSTMDNYCSIRVKLRLKRMGAIRAIFLCGSIPDTGDVRKSCLVGKLKRAIERGPIKSFKWLFVVFFRKLAVSFIRPGLVVVSGEKSIHSIGYACELIKAHNLDYDIYLQLKKSINLLGRGYAVFIDQDYCFHSDRIYTGDPAPTTPEKYFPAVCDALLRISDALEIALCVAAHPRSSYQQKDQAWFEGIPIEYDKTAKLIRDCTIVVSHDSTAVQFAVLFGKPIAFVTTDELNASDSGASIACFASVLGKSVINIDRDLDKVDWNNELCVDYQKYADYRNKYIKIDGSPEKPLWDIVIDHIDKYNGSRSSTP